MVVTRPTWLIISSWSTCWLNGEKMKLEITQEKLTGLLVKAKKAYSVYEKGLGYGDENWSEWYAGYIVDRLEREATNI